MSDQNYRLLRGKHFKSGKTYREGELVSLTAEEFKAFENKFEPVAPAPAPAPAENPAETGKGRGRSKKAEEPAQPADEGEDGDPGMGEGGE